MLTAILIVAIVGVILYAAITAGAEESNAQQIRDYNEEFEKSQEKEQQELYEKYLNSPLTEEIIEFISTPTIPTRIQVWGNKIVSFYSFKEENSKTYLFAEHGVPSISIQESVSKPVSQSDFKSSSKEYPIICLFIRPRLLLARAISTILSNRNQNTSYSCVDGDDYALLNIMVPPRDF